MSVPSDGSHFSASTRGHPNSAPSSPPKAPILAPAPSHGSPKAEETPVPPPSRSALLVAAESGGNAGAEARSKKQGMGAEPWPELSNSGLVAPVKSSSSDSLKSQSDGSSSNASKGGDTSSSISANEGLATSRQTPNLPQTPRIADRGRESFPEDLSNKGNSNRAVEVMQQQQIGGNHRRVSYGGKQRVQTDGGGSRLGRYANRGVHQRNAPHGFIRNPHMWMPSPPLRAQPQPFIPAPQAAAMGFYIIPPHDQLYAPYPYYFPPPPTFEAPTRVPFIPQVRNQVPDWVSPAMSRVRSDQQSIKLKKQIEYYFSVDNLIKDLFLRKNMDHEGWVPISVIASFPNVKQVTDNIPFILDALRGSTVVEIQGEKVKKRDDWDTWILPSSPEAIQLVQSLCR